MYAARRPVRRKSARRASGAAASENENEDDNDSENGRGPQEDGNDGDGGNNFEAIEPSFELETDQHEPQRSETVDEEDRTEESVLIPTHPTNNGIDENIDNTLPDTTVNETDHTVSGPNVGYDNSTGRHFADESEFSTTHLDAQTLYNFSHSQRLIQETALRPQVSPPAPVPASVYHDSPDSRPSLGGDLTMRWLDLLIGDATLNYGPLPDLSLHQDGFNIFGNSVAQTPVPTDEAETPATHDGPEVTLQNAYLQERIPDNKATSRDKKLWQAAEPIALQPQEHVLFRHFTEHISRWVCVFDRPGILLLTIELCRWICLSPKGPSEHLYPILQ